MQTTSLGCTGLKVTGCAVCWEVAHSTSCLTEGHIVEVLSKRVLN